MRLAELLAAPADSADLAEQVAGAPLPAGRCMMRVSLGGVHRRLRVAHRLVQRIGEPEDAFFKRVAARCSVGDDVEVWKTRWAIVALIWR